MMSQRKKAVLKVGHFIRNNERFFKGSCIAVVLLVVLGFGFLSTADAQNATFIKTDTANVDSIDSIAQASSNAAETINENESANETLCVYVCGCVNQPGVYYLPQGARVCDAIEKALGLCENAALESINLAQEIHDGEQITIPSLDEANQLANNAGETVSQGSSTDAQNGGSLLININTANSTQLQQIPGIGAAYAQRIIDYRNAHGSYSSVDDLVNVSGIGSKRIESIRSYVCV